MEKKRNYFACYIRTDNGILWYSFGTDRKVLEEGISDMDNYTVSPCTEEAYRLACEGRWEEIALYEGGDVVDAGKGRTVNVNPPVVRAIVEGRDF